VPIAIGIHKAIKALTLLGLLLRSHFSNRRKPRPLSDFLLSRSYRDEAYRTIIRVMQLGRSYSRRLKSVKYEIYELYPSARHAYNTIRPAVKTSRPPFLVVSYELWVMSFKLWNINSYFKLQTINYKL
jgi:hypothetical protein